MLVRTLRLRNFRQFRGDQAVTFATAPASNVTVIMGENDSGKTTLAQAFTWCLYGDTDFEDKSMLCKEVALGMLPGSEETVRVELGLTHGDLDYTIIREQRYSKDSSGNMRKPGQTVFRISYRAQDGQQEYVRDIETEIRMKEILPQELSRYFFFDGERIGNMSKEIRRGKSQEFARAVRSLLGLSAFTAAMEHLKSKTSKVSVIRSYEDSYDDRGDAMVAQYTRQIASYDERIERIEARLEEIENEQLSAEEKCAELEDKIRAHAEGQQLEHQKERLVKRRDGLVSQRATNVGALLRSFNNAGLSYFCMKPMRDALERLAEAERLDNGIPDIHQNTIDFLVKRGKCLCGADVTPGTDAHRELMRVLEYIPPQSIGTLVGQFVRDCEMQSKNGASLMDEIREKYTIIRDSENDHAEILSDIAAIEAKLENMPSVGALQQSLKIYEDARARLRKERDALNQERGSTISARDRCASERDNLALKDENNRKIRVYRAYAQYMLDHLREEYEKQESQTRAELERTINAVFQSIFAGDFSLTVDEKYDVRVVVNRDSSLIEDVEAGTARSTSVIFAFIAGVIKMARRRRPESDAFVSEPYPLVMDAPLSSFDRARIKTVCDTLPSIAEQVVIFIKDTDGELAEEYLGTKVGARYILEKKGPFETFVARR